MPNIHSEQTSIVNDASLSSSSYTNNIDIHKMLKLYAYCYFCKCNVCDLLLYESIEVMSAIMDSLLIV